MYHQETCNIDAHVFKKVQLRIRKKLRWIKSELSFRPHFFVTLPPSLNPFMDSMSILLVAGRTTIDADDNSFGWTSSSTRRNENFCEKRRSQKNVGQKLEMSCQVAIHSQHTQREAEGEKNSLSFIFFWSSSKERFKKLAPIETTSAIQLFRTEAWY